MSAGWQLTSYPHPLTGPDGGELAVDVAQWGDSDAPSAVLVVSGTHGVEGLCGSALQTTWLSRNPQLPPGVRVALVHALNPHGFAWLRRVNEDNVDLNRNFIDWDRPLPHNDDYDTMAADLVPSRWDDDTRNASMTALAGHFGRLGPRNMQAAVSRGQYRHPTGVFYGGNGPVWSNRWLRTWVADTMAAHRTIAVIDLHSGLGPWGHGEFINHHPAGTPGYERARSVFGDVRSTVDGESVSVKLSGDWLDAFDLMAPWAQVTSVCLEFGTVDMLDVLEALRADAWLHGYGDPHSTVGDVIRQQVREAFADDNPAWLAMLWDRFEPAMNAACGFAGSTHPAAD